MTELTETGSYIVLTLRTDWNTAYCVMSDHLNELKSAHRDWTEKKIDRQLELITVDTSEMLIASSSIDLIMPSTPETRARSKAWNALKKLEEGFDA